MATLKLLWTAKIVLRKRGMENAYGKKYRTIKDNKKMHMHQVRELLFCGCNNLSSDTESNNNLEEVFKNQEEPECSFDNHVILR